MGRIGWTGAALVLSLGLVSGCAGPRTQLPAVDSSLSAAEAEKQREFILRDAVEGQRHVVDVAFPLLIAAAPFCPEQQEHVIGMMTLNLDVFEGAYRDVAHRAFGLDDRLEVFAVHKGSPAEAAGIEPGDGLVSLDGDAVPRGSGANEAWHKLIETAVGRDPEGFDLVVERAGSPKVVRLAPVTACSYDVALELDEDVNAYADGEKIIVTRGMLRFVESDAELALVIAHEIAHNAMGHADAEQQNALGGAAGGLLLDILAAAAGVNTGGAFARAGAEAGRQAYSVEFEQEADYVGLYIVARSGHATDEAPNFWRRMATLSPAAVTLTTTHPPTSERFVALEQTAAEIERKRAAGAELLPEMRPEAEQTTSRMAKARKD